MKIKAAVTYGKEQDFIIEEVDLKNPKANEVLVRIVATGICHTDAVARDAELIPLPAVLGHEGAGIVEKIGGGVTHLAKGDHVVLSFAHCGHCDNCAKGHPTVCESFNELNFGGKHDDCSHRLYKDESPLSTFFGQSSFGTYAVVHERNVVKVDKSVDLAILGPLGCGIQTGAGTVLNKLKPEFGSTIAIYGAGAVGLSAIMAAKVVGCKKIIAVDVHESRLTLAKKLGATDVLNGSQLDVVQEIKKLTNGGTTYAVDTTGVPPVVRQGLRALRPLGTAAVVGITPEMNIDVHNDIMLEGKTMMGVIEGDSIPNVFIPQMIEYYKDGRFPFDRLLTVYEFEEINKAFSDSKNGTAIKPIVRIAKN